MTWQVINGNSAEILKQYPDNSFDAVVTDPPYGINFLNKGWDSNVGEEEVYRQCYRVLKPGGHILAFSAARTYHHLAMTIERVGFEVRDQIMWIYGSGFPKSQDIGRQIDKSLGKGIFTGTGVTQVSAGMRDFTGDKLPRTEKLLHEPESEEAKRWSGWGTQLKPAHEPICMARKPLDCKNIATNVQQWGVGALNIDACRVATTADDKQDGFVIGSSLGRFPANIIHDGSDEVVSMFPHSKDGVAVGGKGQASSIYGNKMNKAEAENIGYGGSGSAARFFYSAKVSKRERNIGHDNVDTNNHPTVKPVELMKYLIKLVAPANSTILDPFNGSGSTGMAAVELGHNYVGIELDPHYCEIARRRIAAWQAETVPFANNPLFEVKK